MHINILSNGIEMIALYLASADERAVLQGRGLCGLELKSNFSTLMPRPETPSGFKVSGLGFRVQDFGFRVQGLGFIGFSV